MLVFAALMSAALVQEADAPPPPQNTAPAPSAAQRIAEAARLGQLIFVFDRAAWVSSDALVAVLQKDQLSDIGGYVVEPAGPQMLRVTYYRGNAAAAQAVFVAEVKGGKVVRSTLLATPVPLSAEQAVLARARDVAAQTAEARAFKPCTPVPFNTVVVPPRAGGPVAVYLLTAEQEAATYPMGGHFRVVIGPDGKVLASRPYTASCMNMTAPKLPKGAQPVGFTVSHHLDPVPTEMHVVASYNLRLPVFVATPDKRLWEVKGSSITLAAAP